MNLTLTSIALLLLICNIIIIFKYYNLKKLVKEYKDIETCRFGVYKSTGYAYSAYVYVKEIDRYTNGYSKIKFYKIEPFDTNWPEDSINHAKKEFASLKLTSDINWLESEDHVKKLRKEKLENLMKK